MDNSKAAFCPYCGAQNTGGTFCGSCGNSISPFADDLAAQDLYCPKCGSANKPGSTFCTHCGTVLAASGATYTQSNSASGTPPHQPVYVFQQQVVQPTRASVGDASWPLKDRTTAGLLAIFLGGLGVHKFYLNKIGTGVLYLLFCWTGIPAVIGLIEGITYLCGSDKNFELTQHVRVK